jgi:NADPH2:quinone reductase
MRAIRFDRFGGPEVLVPVDVPAPEPGRGQLLVTVEAAGVNFADVHRADGSYLAADRLPYVPGSEVVGHTPDGRRVLARLRTGGGYAEQAVVEAADAVDLSDDVAAGDALAVLVQGLTAWHLLKSAARMAPGETVVVHSAAGGVGSLAVQLAKQFGAGRVLAQASTPAKQQLALELGADAIATYPLAERADVILDAVGGKLFDQALESLGDFGRVVTYGRASGEPFTPIDPDRLSDLNVAVVGFWVAPTLRRPGAFREPLADLLRLTREGRLRPVVGAEYPLAEARRAHEDLLARRSTGKLILRPT